VFFPGDDRLEGILEWPQEAAPAPAHPEADGPAAQRAEDRSFTGRRPAGGVVVAHPHPLYGGTMAQPVVYRVAQACRQRGLATLRFNFRGVGQSKGHYSGIEEYRDVEAAAAYLRGRLAEAGGGREAAGRPLPLALAGYSFGSVMAALAAASGTVPVQALALVALVLRWEEWEPALLHDLARFRNPVLAVCGELDDLAPPEVVEDALRKLELDFRMAVIPGAGHMFEHQQREVAERVAAFLADTLR
jgi:uncharacterized protein